MKRTGKQETANGASTAIQFRCLWVPRDAADKRRYKKWYLTSGPLVLVKARSRGGSVQCAARARL